MYLYVLCPICTFNLYASLFNTGNMYIIVCLAFQVYMIDRFVCIYVFVYVSYMYQLSINVGCLTSYQTCCNQGNAILHVKNVWYSFFSLIVSIHWPVGH